MEINLIAETFKFLVLGMSTVFVFLTLMVYAMHLQAKIVLKYFPIKPEEDKGQSTQRVSQNGNNAVVAAIVAALHKHKH